jgi:hypothetical protein
MCIQKISRSGWILLISIALFLCASCGGALDEKETQPSSNQGDEITFKTIAQKAPLGDHPVDPAYLVLTEQSQWEELQGVIPDQALTAGKALDGWDSNLVLVVFSGAKGSSGYTIEVDSINSTDSGWTVNLIEGGPDADQITEPAMTLPYAIVQVPREYLPKGNQLLVEFVDQERSVLSTSEILIP